MKGDIGLIIWGLKGGHRVFCSNSVVDFIKDDEIKNTITDTRSYSRFNQINLTSYGLEFTRKYKVFTIYRSCYDNGKGGYVAITLYVPHEKKVENIRAALDSMMDAYFKEFVHPGFGTYLRDKYDDIDLFSSYIDRLRVTQETELCKYSPSEQSSNPHVLVYNTDTDVDEYFKSPYRKEFFNCQEVMLLSHDIYDKRPQTLELDSKAIIIDKISEPEFLPQLNVGDNKEVALLEINGTEVEKSKSYQINAATTKIRIIIKRKYCEDYTIIGNVADLIQKGTLKERSNIISLGHYDHLLQYINYKIMFKANGKRVLDNVLYIKEKSPSNGARPRSITNSCVTINGQDLTKDFELYLMPYSQLENKFIKINDKFKPSEYADSNRPFEINLKEYEFNVNVEKSVSDKYFYVYVSKGLRNIKVEIPHVRTTTTIKIFLPVDTDTSDISFDVATKETECSFENGTLTLSSKVLDYELELTSPVMKCVQSWDFIISNKSKKKIAIMGMRYKIKIDSSDDIRKGELTINGDKYKYDVDEENAKIVPYLICVRLDNRTSSEFTYITLWNNKEKTTSQNEIFPYHSKTEVDVKVDEEKYEKTKSSEGFNGLIKIIDIKEKSVYPYNIANRYDFVPRDKKDDEFGDEKVPEKLKLIFSNCNGFCIYRETRNEPFSINKNYYERNLSSDSIQIKDEKQKLLCKIYKDKKKYTYETQEFNENNGFFLEYDYNAGTCTVTYSKPSRSSCEEHEMKKSFKERLKPPYRKRTLLIALLLLLVLIIGGVWAYNYYNSAESIAIGVFEFDNKYGEEIESVKFSEDSEWLKVGEDGISVEVYSNKNKQQEVLNDIQNISIYVNFNGVREHTSDTLRLSEEAINKIQIALQHEDGGATPVDFIIHLTTPIQYLMAKLKNEVDTVESNDKKLGIYSVYVTKVELSEVAAIDEILSEASTLLHENSDYATFLTYFKAYSDRPVYKDVENKLNGLNKAQEVAANELQLKNDANKKKAQLQSLDCTPQTVQAVKKWYDGLDVDQKKVANKVYNFSAAFEVYNKFFNATNIDAVKALLNYKSYFGKEQYEVISAGFCKGTKEFKALSKGKSPLEFKSAHETYKTWQK